jgi:hypothetical protein
MCSCGVSFIFGPCATCLLSVFHCFVVLPPEMEDFHPFFVCLSLVWRVIIGMSVKHVHKPWSYVLE